MSHDSQTTLEHKTPESNKSVRGMRCPPASPLFASSPWLLHPGCSLETIDMTGHERHHERGYSRSTHCSREAPRAVVACASHRLVVYTAAVRKSQARTRERTSVGLTGLVR